MSGPATWAVVPAKRLDGALQRLAPALGVRPVLTDALMPDRPARARLAAEALEAVA